METSALILLLAGTLVMLALLAATIAAKRLWRNAAELRIAARRTRYAAALARGGAHGGAEVCAAAGHGGAALFDACREVDRAWSRLSPADRAALDSVVRIGGVPRHLVAGCRSRALVRRSRSAAALGYLRLPEGLPQLERRLVDRDLTVRLIAAGALGRIGTPASARALMDAIAARRLPEERLVEALAGAWAVPALLAAFADPARAGIRPALAEALGLVGSPAAIEPFALAMPAAEAELRLRMVRALGRIGGPAAGEVVAEAMADEDWRVRAQAARALAEIGRRRRAVPLLERGLRDSSWWVRANCGAGLRRLGPSGVTALRRALRSDDRFARDRAREALDMEAAQRRAA